MHAPDTEPGQRLLAHELAHTIQQGAHTAGISQSPEIGSPAGTEEQAAENAANAVSHAQPVAEMSAYPRHVARQGYDALAATPAPAPGVRPPSPPPPGPASSRIDIRDAQKCRRDEQ